MSPTLITREMLRMIILDSIRQHDGCAGVEDVAVTGVKVTNAEMTWHVNVVGPGNANPQLAHRVASNIRDQCVDKYKITDL